MITLNLKAQKNAYDEFADEFIRGLPNLGGGFCLIRDEPNSIYLARATYGIGAGDYVFYWEDDWWEGQPCTLLGIIYDEELLAYTLKQRNSKMTCKD